MALTEKGVMNVRNLIAKVGPRNAGIKLINLNLGMIEVSDLPDTMTLANGLDTIEEMLQAGDINGAYNIAKETANEMLEDEGFSMFENKEPIKENKKKMKIVNYKNKFNSLEEALAKVPKELRVNENVFKLSDGNKTIKARWEGTLTEGKAVALLVEDKALIAEDMSHMKHLMGYKSESTIGTPKAENRVTENDTFRKLLADTKKKRLNESSEINLDEAEELLDEGILSKFAKIAAMVGMSLASFQTMAQESPEKAVAAVKTEVKKLTPEQIKNIEKATGITFHADTANRLFSFEPTSKEMGASSASKEMGASSAPAQANPVQDLYLGKYGDIKAAKVVNTNASENGGHVYTVQLNSMYGASDNFSNVRSYIGKNNQKLQNSTIRFVNQDGSHYGGKDINF